MVLKYINPTFIVPNIRREFILSSIINEFNYNGNKINGTFDLLRSLIITISKESNINYLLLK